MCCLWCSWMRYQDARKVLKVSSLVWHYGGILDVRRYPFGLIGHYGQSVRSHSGGEWRFTKNEEMVVKLAFHWVRLSSSYMPGIPPKNKHFSELSVNWRVDAVELFDCVCTQLCGCIYPAYVYTQTHDSVYIPGVFVWCVWMCVTHHMGSMSDQMVGLENMCEITGIPLRYTACLTYSI